MSLVLALGIGADWSPDGDPIAEMPMLGGRSNAMLKPTGFNRID